MDKADFGVNDFLNAEQRIRLACVLRMRKEKTIKGYITEDFFLSAREILFVLSEDTKGIQALNHFMDYVMKQKIKPLLVFKEYDKTDIC